MLWTVQNIHKISIKTTEGHKLNNRDGVEKTRLEAKAKDKKKSEAKAKDIFSEDRTSRGQGQQCSRPRSRTKDTGAIAFSKKKQKRSSKNFLDGLQFIGVARIFGWGRPKPQITWNDAIKIFPKKKFLWDKDIVGWKIWNRCGLFALNQDFAKEEGLN